MLPDLKVGIRSVFTQFHLLSSEVKGSFGLLRTKEVIVGARTPVTEV